MIYQLRDAHAHYILSEPKHLQNQHRSINITLFNFTIRTVHLDLPQSYTSEDTFMKSAKSHISSYLNKQLDLFSNVKQLQILIEAIHMHAAPWASRVKDHSVLLLPLGASSRHSLPRRCHSVDRRSRHEEQHDRDQEERHGDDENDPTVAMDLVIERLVAAAGTVAHLAVGGGGWRELLSQLGGRWWAVTDLAVIRGRLRRFLWRLQLL